MRHESIPDHHILRNTTIPSKKMEFLTLSAGETEKLLTERANHVIRIKMPVNETASLLI
ncbi:MAG: hypothetical protein IPI68_11220 [Chitinophagaceae bacterium]|nr:hypothetical protein [Chitinophagaceae bacterium]